MKKQLSIAMASLCLLLTIACSKSKYSPEAPVEDPTTITEVGERTGPAISKTIGANGGQIASPDGTVQVVIPAGALVVPTQITIQHISNKLPGGIGGAYRLLPHGVIFAKPVKVVFNYENDDLKNTTADFLDIAFQDPEGSWIAIPEATRDKANRQITVNTNHFSDWGFFKSLNLDPAESTVQLSGSVDLKVSTRFPYTDPDDPGPYQSSIKILKNPRALRPHEIRGWTYAGEGMLISRAAEAFYTAPDHEPAANPEVVNCNIKMARKGQFMLVANITVLAGHNVTYLKVDEDYKRNGNGGNCKLYLYGAFGNDPGTGKRTVKINGEVVTVDIWSPTILRCSIDREIAGAIEIISNNKTVARSVLAKYTGSFIYKRFHGGVSNAGSSNPLKESTEFKIVYRGFGGPPPPGLDLKFTFDGMAAFGTRADYMLGGAASVSMPPSNGCQITTSVSLNDASGTLLHNTIGPTQWSHFDCDIKDIAGGIEISIDFQVDDVITGVRVKRTNCTGSSLDPARPLGVGLEGFGNQPIYLAFDGGSGLKLKQVSELRSGNISSSILIEAWDGTGNPSHYQTDGLMPATIRNK